jgi:predicted heme/steroid binding protein
MATIDEQMAQAREIVERHKAQHTPGPWYAVYNGYFYDISLSKHKYQGGIAISCATNPNDKWNAALLAAAPDLLEALESAYAHLGNNSHQWEGRYTLAGQSLLSSMRDAIAKATNRDAQEVQDYYCNLFLKKARGDV